MRTPSIRIITTPKDRKAQIDKWLDRDYSWSQHSSWEWNKEQWFEKYVLNKETPPNAVMLFGNTVGDTLGLPTSMVPKLNPSLVGIKEYELRVKMDKIKLLGFADHYCPDTKFLNENKTSTNAKKWNPKSVHKHRQLDMYGLLLLLQNNTRPEEVRMQLNYIPTVETTEGDIVLVDPNEFYSFTTSRTTEQCLNFGNEILAYRKAMLAYALGHD